VVSRYIFSSSQNSRSRAYEEYKIRCDKPPHSKGSASMIYTLVSENAASMSLLQSNLTVVFGISLVLSLAASYKPLFL